MPACLITPVKGFYRQSVLPCRVQGPKGNPALAMLKKDRATRLISLLSGSVRIPTEIMTHSPP